ncbi:hypothetical protein GMST_08380 [Geomonas silvestris]|uniref:Ice-binding protein C-terminal domain-containing protein n=1 Tax=Geomonas silvestris TaxID=2740184 RepID=A0A6V8MFD1_9BACT|nr:PEP-CTERM sorting domain-containing protein [Geomonas silvestris]GFO58513.1 hypothetical protein GMST_08380 [Geomonas silvestris]
MKKFVAVLVGGMVFGLAGMASAYTLNYNYQLDGNGGMTSPYASVLVETFDAGDTLNLTLSGDFNIVQGNASGLHAAPTGPSGQDQTNYLTVPNARSTGSTFATGFGTANYLGLWWGSIDVYNTFNFYNNNVLVQSFTGSQVSTLANGSWTNPATNKYVNILDLPDFDKIEFVSTQYAFETDNIAVGTVVPEPGTMMLLGAGFLGLAIFVKRRKSA